MRRCRRCRPDDVLSKEPRAKSQEFPTKGGGGLVQSPVDIAVAVQVLAIRAAAASVGVGPVVVFVVVPRSVVGLIGITLK
ncbi:hypothetical protein ACHAWF_010688 [Thalassiosira exigua]